MTPATWPRDERVDDRLLVIDPVSGALRDARVRDLPRHLSPGDLLVLNDAATMPASFPAHTESGAPVELRLATQAGAQRWRAVLFGRGDWHTRTEDRPLPPPVRTGDTLRIGPELAAIVEEVDPEHPRLLVVRFDRCQDELGIAQTSGSCAPSRSTLQDAPLWAALYRHGHPVQYAHVARDLDLWHVQTPFASRPWAVEMPSAGRPLAWSVLSELRARGVRLAVLTHAAGMSSTGDAALDAVLPMPERFDIQQPTVLAVARAHAEGRRVVAVGTTVVRALEGCARLHGGELVAGEGTTDLRIDARFRPRVVDGLLTGLHEIGSSHRQLLHAFAPELLLARAWSHAEAVGYMDHEFGDVCLVVADHGGGGGPTR